MAHRESLVLENKVANSSYELNKDLFDPLPKVPLCRCHFSELNPTHPINLSTGKTVTDYLLRLSLWLTPSWFLRLHAGNHPRGKNPHEKSPLKQCPKLTAEPKKCLSIQQLSPFSILFNARGPCHVSFLNNTASFRVPPFLLYKLSPCELGGARTVITIVCNKIYAALHSRTSSGHGHFFYLPT